MNTLVKRIEQKEGYPFLHKIVFALLAAAMLVVFLRPNYETVCGPVMVAAFVFLFFAGYHEFVFAVIITANDALGTMFLGELSFQYLLLALAMLKILQTLKISKRRLAFFLTALYFLAQLLWVGMLPIKTFINVFSYVIAVSAIMMDTDGKALARFFTGVAVTVTLIAVHAMLTGGVVFYEDPDHVSMIYQEDFLRRGILGAGSGNANHSAFLLNIGTIAVWYFTSWGLPIKILCTVPILYAFVLTNSISALLALALVLVLAVLFKQKRDTKKSKRLFTVCLVVFLILALCFVYINLPKNMRFKELDGFLDRIEEKLEFAQDGDWNNVTTNRSYLATKYLRYIFLEQNILGLLFGGNPLIVPEVSGAIAHNNYVGLLLQIGLVGTLLFLAATGKRLHFIWKERDVPYRKGRLLLKCFCLFAAFGISLYGSSLWTFWMFILLLL